MSAVHPIETDPSQVQDRACNRLIETETETETDSDCRRQTSNEPTEVDMTKRAKLNKRWHRRLKILLCCLGYKKNKVSVELHSSYSLIMLNLTGKSLHNKKK